MARITVEDCIDKFDSRFELVLVASNRARKLHSGEQPTVEKDNDKNTVIALREIADETISVDQFKLSLVEEYQSTSPIDDEELALDSDDDIEDQEADSEINSEVTDENIKTEVGEKISEDNPENSDENISDDMAEIETDQAK